MRCSVFTKIVSALSLTLALASCGSEDNDSRIVISLGDDIIELNSLQYQLPLVVQVADLTGNPQADTAVTLGIKITGFSKGRYTYTDTDIPPDGTLDKWAGTTTANCTPEDTNNNGILDTGEDTNSNGLLDPNIPTITPHPSLTPTLVNGTLITDSNGFGYFTITYPKSQGTWVSVQLTATADDGLAENTGQSTFGLYILRSDLDNPEDLPPPFAISPYGPSAGCNTTS